jgi:hypothetical protein
MPSGECRKRRPADLEGRLSFFALLPPLPSPLDMTDRASRGRAFTSATRGDSNGVNPYCAIGARLCDGVAPSYVLDFRFVVRGDLLFQSVRSRQTRKSRS